MQYPNIAVTLTEDKWTYVVEYPMDHILERYSKESGLSFDACREHELELKRYLYLCSIYPDKVLGMSGPVDALWHLFITFTREYHEFCNNTAGRYIHHVPKTDKEPKNGAASYKDMLLLYLNQFGSEPPRHIWPIIKNSGDDAFSNCEGCSTCSPGPDCHQSIFVSASCNGCVGCGDFECNAE